MLSKQIYPHLFNGIIDALVEIFQDGAMADRVVNRVLKEHKKWGARDRRTFAESVYECVRWRRRLWFTAGLDDSQFDNPGYNTPENIEKIWHAWHTMSGKVSDHWKKAPTRAIRESIPDWLDALGERELGKSWDSILESLNKTAKVYLRLNRLKTNRENLLHQLEKEGVRAISPDEVFNKDLTYLVERKNVFITEAFKKGFFEVQDAGSQWIVPFMNLEPGMRVIDACAGGGGKSLHMASLMQNRGKIVAMDKNDWRLKPLRERASRAGADIIETRIITSSKVIKRLVNTADRLLLDVPCSGSGALRRSPDSKWKFTESERNVLLNIQQEILQSYCKMVKKGGLMVYSTCSVFPSENHQQVEKFLASDHGKNWILEDALSIIPDSSLEPGVVKFEKTFQHTSGYDSPGDLVTTSEFTDQKEKSSIDLTASGARVSAPRKLFQNSDGFYMARLKQI